MALSPGTRLGPYEIVSAIGAGGMGEVYRAKDTRLDRTVAVKILPVHLSGNEDLRQRFDREARSISSLSHPHICALYDVGHQDGIDFLVMEFLEGETLDKRISKGPFTTELVVRYGCEIADALDKAHRQGIVHRDLKPGNIMLTKSGLKLLDFGLAKLSTPPISIASPDVSLLATEQPKNLTAEGMILGTVQYMSPEQLEGRETDPRTDIFALGTVLYEMVTGNKAFTGKSQASLISAILKDEPAPISQTQPMTPPGLDHVVKKCLAKDPEDRWQTAHDVGSELKWISEGSSQTRAVTSVTTRRKSREIFWKASTVILLIVASFLAFLHWRTPSDQSQLMRFTISTPSNTSFAGSMAISPDGRKLAFISVSGGIPSLWLRSLDSLSPHILSGTEGASAPFWSPDCRWIAFFAQGKMKKIEASGGSPQIICDAADTRGGTWSREGVILFSPSSNDGLYLVSADGGAVTQVTKPDPSANETSHRWPWFLPDARHFVYLVLSGQVDKQGIFVGSLDSRESKRLLTCISNVFYVSPGYLIFINDGTLMSQQFDSSSLQLKGQPVPIAEQIWTDSLTNGLSAVSVSENGVLVYRTGGTQNSQFTWFDRNGNKLSTVGPPGRYAEPYFSGDEKRIVFEISNSSAFSDLWILDLTGGNLSRFTFDPSDETTAVWSPDGDRIVWASSRSGAYDLYQKAASGAGKNELLLKSINAKYPDDWSRDGRFILYESVDPKTKFDVWVLPMFGDHKPMPYLLTEFNEAHSRFSPDGKWIAYVSDESGRAEVYVQSFPSSGGKWQISTGGGDQPYWRRDGKELFYVALDATLMAADVNPDASIFPVSAPKPLFKIHIPTMGITSARNQILITADGQRFLINNSMEDAASSTITQVFNWPALLKR